MSRHKFYVEPPDSQTFVTTAADPLEAVANYFRTLRPIVAFEYQVHLGQRSKALTVPAPLAGKLLSHPEQARLLQLIDKQLSHEDMRRFVIEATGGE